MEVTDAGMMIEVIMVFLNVSFPITVHPSPSSTTLGPPADNHMALVKVVLPEVYDMSTMSKETTYVL